MAVQLTLERHGFELLWSPFTQILFFKKYTQRFLTHGFHIHRFNQPWMENSIFTFSATVFQLQIPNLESKHYFHIPSRISKILFRAHGWLNLLMQKAHDRVKSYTQNLYNFINHCHPNKFNKKEKNYLWIFLCVG